MFHQLFLGIGVVGDDDILMAVKSLGFTKMGDTQPCVGSPTLPGQQTGGESASRR